MTKQFTAIYLNRGSHFIGYIEEVPGANTQGATLDEVKKNLKEALTLTLDANRMLIEKEIGTGGQRELLTIQT